jgi:hypothetical protein
MTNIKFTDDVVRNKVNTKASKVLVVKPEYVITMFPLHYNYKLHYNYELRYTTNYATL